MRTKRLMFKWWVPLEKLLRTEIPIHSSRTLDQIIMHAIKWVIRQYISHFTAVWNCQSMVILIPFWVQRPQEKQSDNCLLHTYLIWTVIIKDQKFYVKGYKASEAMPHKYVSLVSPSSIPTAFHQRILGSICWLESLWALTSHSTPHPTIVTLWFRSKQTTHTTSDKTDSKQWSDQDHAILLQVVDQETPSPSSASERRLWSEQWGEKEGGTRDQKESVKSNTHRIENIVKLSMISRDIIQILVFTFLYLILYYTVSAWDVCTNELRLLKTWWWHRLWRTELEWSSWWIVV